MQGVLSFVVFFILIGVGLPVNFIFGAERLDVVINEIAWMGTIVSANDEWIELYNNTENPINLDGWQLTAQDETPKINLSGTIPANGFYLLERTDNTTVPNVPADHIYTGALGNSGENLKLYNGSNNVIDEADCSAGWFAGLGKPEYRTMEKINPMVGGNDSSNWRTSQDPDGTPRAQNSLVVQTESKEEEKPSIITAPKTVSQPKSEEKSGGVGPRQAGLAAIGSSPAKFLAEEDKQISKSFFLFLIPLGLAIFSGAIILFLKRKLRHFAKSL